MPVDASIYSMIRPPERQPGPLDNYAAMMQLRAMGDQSQLHSLQRTQLQRSMRDEESASEAARLSGGSMEKLHQLYLERGLSKPAMDLQGKILTNKKTQGEIDKNAVEVFGKQAEQLRNRLSTVRGDEDLPPLREFMTKVYGPRAAASMPQSVSDPAWSEWQTKGMQTADQFVEQTKPKIEKVTDGKKEFFVDTNPITNPAIRTMQIQKVTTPGEDLTAATSRRGQDITAGTTRRGQDMTDRRERDVTLATDVARARETGKEQAVAAQNAPTAIANANRAVRLVDDLLKHPGFTQTVGAAIIPGQRFVPGTDAADFQARLDELQGGAFLAAFETLKGGGQITEMEGKKATDAINRMKISQSEAEFVKAAREYQDVVRTGAQRAAQKAGTPNKVPDASGGQTAGGKIGGAGAVLTPNGDGTFTYGAPKRGR